MVVGKTHTIAHRSGSPQITGCHASGTSATPNTRHTRHSPWPYQPYWPYHWLRNNLPSADPMDDISDAAKDVYVYAAAATRFPFEPFSASTTLRLPDPSTTVVPKEEPNCPLCRNDHAGDALSQAGWSSQCLCTCRPRAGWSSHDPWGPGESSPGLARRSSGPQVIWAAFFRVFYLPISPSSLLEALAVVLHVHRSPSFLKWLFLFFSL